MKKQEFALKLANRKILGKIEICRKVFRHAKERKCGRNEKELDYFADKKTKRKFVSLHIETQTRTLRANVPRKTVCLSLHPSRFLYIVRQRNP